MIDRNFVKPVITILEKEANMQGVHKRTEKTIDDFLQKIASAIKGDPDGDKHLQVSIILELDDKFELSKSVALEGSVVTIVHESQTRIYNLLIPEERHDFSYQVYYSLSSLVITAYQEKYHERRDQWESKRSPERFEGINTLTFNFTTMRAFYSLLILTYRLITFHRAYPDAKLRENTKKCLV